MVKQVKCFVNHKKSISKNKAWFNLEQTQTCGFGIVTAAQLTDGTDIINCVGNRCGQLLGLCPTCY